MVISFQARDLAQTEFVQTFSFTDSFTSMASPERLPSTQPGKTPSRDELDAVEEDLASLFPSWPDNVAAEVAAQFEMLESSVLQPPSFIDGRGTGLSSNPLQAFEQPPDPAHSVEQSAAATATEHAVGDETLQDELREDASFLSTASTPYFTHFWQDPANPRHTELYSVILQDPENNRALVHVGAVHSAGTAPRGRWMPLSQLIPIVNPGEYSSILGDEETESKAVSNLPSGRSPVKSAATVQFQDKNDISSTPLSGSADVFRAQTPGENLNSATATFSNSTGSTRNMPELVTAKSLSQAPTAGSGGQWHHSATSNGLSYSSSMASMAHSISHRGRGRGRGGGMAGRGRGQGTTGLAPGKTMSVPATMASYDDNDGFAMHEFTHLWMNTAGVWQGCQIVSHNKGFVNIRTQKSGSDLIVPDSALIEFDRNRWNKSVHDDTAPPVIPPPVDCRFMQIAETQSLETESDMKEFISSLTQQIAPIHLDAALQRVARAFLQSIRHLPVSRIPHSKRILWASPQTRKFMPVQMGEFFDLRDGRLDIWVTPADEIPVVVPLYQLFQHSPDLVNANFQIVGSSSRSRPPVSLIREMGTFLRDHKVDEFLTASRLDHTPPGDDGEGGGGDEAYDAHDDQDSHYSRRYSQRGGSRDSDNTDDSSVTSEGSSHQRRKRGKKKKPKDWSGDNQKFDVSKVHVYEGLHQAGPPSHYWLRPLAWCRRVYSIMLGAGVREQNLVFHALHCVKDSIYSAYKNQKLRPFSAGDIPNWDPWNSEHPIDKNGLKFEAFVQWLCENHPVPVNIEQLKAKFEGIAQFPTETVRDFNQRFTDDFNMIQEMEMAMYPADHANLLKDVAQSDRHVRFRYMSALRPEIGEKVHFIVMSNSLSSLCQPNLTESQLTQTQSSIRYGQVPFPVSQLQEIAVGVERSMSVWEDHKKQQLHRQNTFRSQAVTQSESKSPWTRKRLALPGPRPTARLHAQITEELDDDEYAAEEDEVNCDLLFNRMVSENKIPWSKSQFLRLVAEKRCFNCGGKDHDKKTCTRPPADPRTFELNALEVVHELPSNTEVLHALSTYDDSSKNGGTSLY